MNLITKVASVGGAIGIVGGSVVITKHYYKGFTDIKARLEGFGYEVLKFDDTDNHEWQKIGPSYEAEQDKSKKFSEKLTELKELCKNALDQSPNDENVYKLASRWCVKEVTVKALLGKQKYTPIKKIKEEAQERSKWEAKVYELKENKDTEIKIDIDLEKGQIDNWITELENTCEKLTADEIKTHNQDDFEKKFIQARSWCALSQEEASK